MDTWKIGAFLLGQKAYFQGLLLLVLGRVSQSHSTQEPSDAAIYEIYKGASLSTCTSLSNNL